MRARGRETLVFTSNPQAESQDDHLKCLENSFLPKQMFVIATALRLSLRVYPCHLQVPSVLHFCSSEQLL